MTISRNRAAAAAAAVLLILIHSWSPASGATDSWAPNASDLLSRALSCLDFMAYDEAASLFEKTLAEEYKREGVRPGLAYAYYRLGKADQALLVLDTELRIRPEDLKSLSMMAFLHHKAGRTEDAERFARAFDAALEKIEKPKTRESALKALGPNAGIPAFILGVIAAGKGQAKSARSRFIEARNLGYFPLACWIGSIDAEIRGENWAEALRLCQAGGNIAPTSNEGSARAQKEIKAVPSKMEIALSADIFRRLGTIYDRIGKPEESLSALQTAAAMKPFDAGVLKSLAIAHLNRGNAAAAETFLDRAIELAPLDFEAISLFDLARSDRLWPKAADFVRAPIPLPADFLKSDWLRFRYVFQGDPDDIADIMNGYALRLVREGLISEALLLLRSFAEIYENSPTIFFNLGLLANSLERRAEALESAMRAVALDREYRNAIDLAANVCFKIGDIATSVALYEEAARLEPNDPVGHYNLGVALLERGEEADAVEHFKEAVRLERASPVVSLAEKDLDALKRAVTITVEPISAPACHSIGMIFVKRGKKDEALNWLLRAVEFNPKNPGPYIEIGKLLMDRGDKDSAEGYFKKYLSAGGDESKLRDIQLKK